jgi:peptide/nickel transport system substrate-binding protein
VRAALTITTTTGDQIRERVEQILIDEWKQIGIALEIKNQPSSTLLSGSWSSGNPRSRGTFDLVMYASSPGVDPHQTMATRFTTKGIPSTANGGIGANYSRVSDPVIDAAIDEAGSTPDQEKRAAAYKRAITRLNELVPLIWMYERSNIEAFRTSVSGYKGSTWADITWNTQDWSVKK